MKFVFGWWMMFGSDWVKKLCFGEDLG